MPSGCEKHSVFIVDHEPAIALTISIILQKEGFDTIPFTEPLEALQVIRGEVPDLLISDVVMPQLSGVELAIQVRELYPECKVLLFSGHPATWPLLEDARAKGHEFGLLTKPAHPRELLQKVQTMLEIDSVSN
jgi:DNA-binding NtrC family response regulator